MAPRRTTYSQNSQANNDVPPPLEGLPPMNVEKLYRYLETLAGLVKRQARAIETQALGQHSSPKDPMEVEAWILKIEKFFDVIDCSEEQKAFYATFMLDKKTDHWWRMTKRLLEDQRPIV
uniref:Retrotransposon gag domain-containing protein n=1 Tax=Vitis vinifera TaxID=29760 RepID=A5C3Q1_VITVI|nr:hypothetical protein VITISV_016096 [Vitis vinifera]